MITKVSVSERLRGMRREGTEKKTGIDLPAELAILPSGAPKLTMYMYTNLPRHNFLCPHLVDFPLWRRRRTTWSGSTRAGWPPMLQNGSFLLRLGFEKMGC